MSVTPYSVYLHTAAGRVRTILWGDYMELQKFREPIVQYLADTHAPPLEVTMWPSTAGSSRYPSGESLYIS